MPQYHRSCSEDDPGVWEQRQPAFSRYWEADWQLDPWRESLSNSQSHGTAGFGDDSAEGSSETSDHQLEEIGAESVCRWRRNMVTREGGTSGKEEASSREQDRRIS